jgi:hypothetical protein
VDLRHEVFRKIHRLASLRFDDLEELHRLYPERAGKARKFVVGRLTEDEMNRDYKRRLGIDPGPIKDGEWPRIWTR